MNLRRNCSWLRCSRNIWSWFQVYIALGPIDETDDVYIYGYADIDADTFDIAGYRRWGRVQYQGWPAFLKQQWQKNITPMIMDRSFPLIISKGFTGGILYFDIFFKYGIISLIYFSLKRSDVDVAEWCILHGSWSGGQQTWGSETFNQNTQLRLWCELCFFVKERETG